MKVLTTLFGVAALAGVIGNARAQEIKIGATLSTTGPAASIGIPIKKTFEILPKSIDGAPISWTILDDATDTTLARKNVDKLIGDNVDLIIGGNTTPTSMATVEPAGASHTPILAIAPSSSIVDPPEGAKAWVFKIPLGERELAERTLRDMAKRKIKSLGFIGFNDALGDGWLKELGRMAPTYGIAITTVEKFGRTDNSVVAQVLKVLATHPDSVFVAATGTPAVLPTASLRERGFNGPIYLTSGVINNDFLRVGAKSVDGVFLAGGPLVVAASLPDSNPSKPVGLEFTKLYNDAYGPRTVSAFGGNAYDAWLVIRHAVPIALAKAKPGTPEFRAALREAIEGITGMATLSGVMNMSKTNHGAYTADTPVILTVKNGAWALVD